MMDKEKVKELISKKIEEIAGGKEDDDFYIEEIEDREDKYKVTVDISYLYEYIDKETMEKLLKAFDDAFIKVNYINAIVNTRIELKNGKVDYTDEIVDCDDLQARLIININKNK